MATVMSIRLLSNAARLVGNKGGRLNFIIPDVEQSHAGICPEVALRDGVGQDSWYLLIEQGR